MKIKLSNIGIHVMGWIIFLSIPHFIFGLIGHGHHPGLHMPHPPMPPHHFLGADLTIIVFNTFLIAFYYINSYILIPYLLGRRRRFWYSVSIIAFMIVVVASPAVVAYMFPWHHSFEPENERQMTAIRILVTTLLFATIFIISTGIRIIREWYGAEQENKQIQIEKTTAELSFLKAQINPHFLFNTLNNIYSLSVKKSEDTSEAILLLADMMRYVLSDAQSDHVPLEMETEYLSKFISLEKLRLTSKVTIEYEVTGNVNADVIAPMILVPFIENAFKFGISTHDPGTISVRIDIHDSILKMSVRNKLFPQTNLIARSSGIGLANVKRRLALLYPDRFRLRIDPDHDGHYEVELELNLSA